MTVVNAYAETIPVVLIDDHPLILEAVARRLESEPDIRLVATGRSGEEVGKLLEQHRPGVMLLDLCIPPRKDTNVRTAGRYPVLGAVRRLAPQYPQTQFIILSAEVNPAVVDAALASGVRGYLVKDDDLSLQLVEAIKTVYRGDIFLSAEVARQVVGRAEEARRRNTAGLLTERQREILQAVVLDANLSYAEQAQRLGISVDTFRNHLRAIFQRLGAANLTCAVVRAVQLGLLPPHLLGLREPPEDKTSP